MSRARRSWSLALAALPLLLAWGCAGGWRNGPPGEAGAPAPATAASAPAPARAPAGGAQEVVFTWEGEGSTVALAGDFNSWSTTADPLTKQDDGTWRIAKKLDPGTYEYKFVIDGSAWKEDPNAQASKADPYGGKNSLVTVTAGAGGATGAAASPAPAAGAAAAGAVAATGAARPPQITAEGVMFTYAGAAKSVALAGDFNGWSTTADPMNQQADGTWTLVKKLDPGTYGYKFLVDGKRWLPDAANPETADDGFGGKNSVVTVN